MTKTPLKWHNAPGGPAPCFATVKPCKYGKVFTSEEAARVQWDQTQLEEHGTLNGLSRKKKQARQSNTELMKAQRDFFSDPRNYEPDLNYFSNYPEAHAETTRTLALNQKPTTLLYVPVSSIDEQFQTRSSTSVQRVILENGQVGYFKAFRENAHVENEIKEWGTSSIQSIANDVNAYRVAQVMGGEYTHLVPETVIREIGGKLGSFQEEVNETIATVHRFKESESLSADFRRAALFDFIIGNVDRHAENYIIDEDDYGDQRIRLIDNSYGMSLRTTSTNVSLFNDNSNYLTGIDYVIPEDSRALTKDDYELLTRVSEAVTAWESAGEMTWEQAEALQDRTTELRIGEEISPLKYFQGEQ